MAGRLIAHFPERLTAEQRIPDELSALGHVVGPDDLLLTFGDCKKFVDGGSVVQG